MVTASYSYQLVSQPGIAMVEEFFEVLVEKEYKGAILKTQLKDANLNDEIDRKLLCITKAEFVDTSRMEYTSTAFVVSFGFRYNRHFILIVIQQQ